MHFKTTWNYFEPLPLSWECEVTHSNHQQDKTKQNHLQISQWIMKWLYYAVSPWYSQLHMVFSSLKCLSCGVIIIIIKIVKGHIPRGDFGPLRVLCFSNRPVMHSFSIRSSTSLDIIILPAKSRRLQNYYTKLYQQQNHWESLWEYDKIEWDK